MNEIEEKKNKLNLELRLLLNLIDIIDGLKGDYNNYESMSLDDVEYLDEQIKLVIEAKTRLLNIFK